MRAATKPGAAIGAPWPWDIAKYCLELPSNAVRHFPAGTYNEQVSTWTGRTELTLMDITHQAWYMFKHLNLGQWGEGELRFAKWLSEKPVPEEPTRVLDDLITALWGVTECCIPRPHAVGGVR